jgi:hypothetical protein
LPSTRDKVFRVEGEGWERKWDTLQIPQIFKMLTHSLVIHKVLLGIVNLPRHSAAEGSYGKLTMIVLIFSFFSKAKANCLTSAND